MKHLTLIIHANAQQDLADFLRSLTHITRFTFSPVEGHGVQDESDPFLCAHDRVVGHTPKVRVDVLLEDQDVETLLDTLKQTRGLAGQTSYWLTPVEQGGSL